MTSGGQSITDRALAAKHTVAGQTLAKSVCKATTEEIISPKRKHLDHLLRCTNDPSVSIPQMANLLIERTKSSSWVVVFKALVTVHTLMNHGNERFTQYLASNSCTFHLDSFYDRSNGMQGYGMSTFIRQYAKYLTQKSYSYRQMAFDFCRAKRGKQDGILRTMNADELLRALPLIQTQFDALVGFEVAAVQITNGIINAAFLLLFRDLIRLYACYNDGIINLLGRYFELNKKSCREAFEIYKLFIARVDKVGQFLKVAENIGVDRGEIPDLAKAPASLVDALEQHLIALENTKKTTMITSVGQGVPYSPVGRTSAKASRTASVAGTICAASVSPSAGKPLPTSRPVVISEAERRHILEEEERMLDVIKQQNIKHSTAVGKSAASSAPPSTQPPNIGAQKLAVSVHAEFNPFDQLDHGFDLPPAPPSHDLLDLQQWSSLSQPVPTINGNSFPGDDSLFFQSSGIQYPSSLLGAESNRADLFGISTFSDLQGFDPMTAVSTSPALMLQARLTPTDFGAPASPCALHLGGTSAGTATRLTAEAERSQRLITCDLDASLATIAGNLSIGTPEHYRRMDHNWAGPIEKRLTGAGVGAGAAVAGESWTPRGSSSPAIYPSSRPAPLNMGGPHSTAMATESQYPAMMTAYPIVMGQPPMTVMGSAPKDSSMFVSHSSSDTKSTTLPQNDPFGFL